MKISPVIQSASYNSRNVQNNKHFINQSANYAQMSKKPSASNYKANYMPLNFGANPLYKLKLKNKTMNDFVNAHFVKLDFEQDKELMEKLAKLWEKADFCSSLKNCFDKKSGEMYAVIKDDNKGFLPENIASLMQLVKDKAKSTIQLEILQSAPDIADNPQSAIRGAGETAIYSAAKLAREEGFDKICLHSANNGFYDRIGMKVTHLQYHPDDRFRLLTGAKDVKPIGGDYELSGEEIVNFLKKVEQKYSI